ncbi:hypothetical protein G6038_15105 [Rhodococcus sp. 14C212]|uniref:hypothetical protein n=1 Tax=Rhodococcus sp. 14C212 TaxID=2711209 RepID=UPI0013EBE99D|nr:hypothetical protein [Rhodococcus sp. 14C212]NGP06785.1 hypothetical protein [Rhodococcus sp. 14C212]
MKITLPNGIVIEDDDPSAAAAAAAALAGLAPVVDDAGPAPNDVPDEGSAGCSEDGALEALHIARARRKPVTVTYLARRWGITPEDALERLAMLVVRGRVEQLSDGIYRPTDNVDESECQNIAAMNAGTPAEESETVPSAEPDPFDAIMTFRREVQALLPTRRDRESYDLFVSRRKRLSSARAAALLELSPAATGVRLPKRKPKNRTRPSPPRPHIACPSTTVGRYSLGSTTTATGKPSSCSSRTTPSSRRAPSPVRSSSPAVRPRTGCKDWLSAESSDANQLATGPTTATTPSTDFLRVPAADEQRWAASFRRSTCGAAERAGTTTR